MTNPIQRTAGAEPEGRDARRRWPTVLLALLAATAVPASIQAQAGAGGPALSEEEVEALQMGQELGFMCNPQRHRGMVGGGSESLIQRDAGDLPGTAVFARTAEGTFLVLEGYDEAQAGHCTVLGWFGGELASGSYEIRRMSMAAMEEEVQTDRHSFFTFSAVRAPGESSVLVTESGTLEVESLDAGRLTGTFTLSGFVIESGARTDGVDMQGSFSALEGSP